MVKTKQDRIVEAIEKLESNIFDLQKDIKYKDKKIYELEKRIRILSNKNDLVKLQRRINILEAELENLINYIRKNY
jgi:predicted  nucleic acid-binding Zn-ribbon protein